ncbi:NAD(P)H-dependent glycerol-3-phosphate dehydrogenase [Methylicorpusculum sp.]|uniref:NAD(P)H-dependent glycerol-3-phosphate dehydrogenase n=1 Tax=Methylicorpusculum sp. TaxID=2713644 RepID=UPI002ABC9355|nr:NAD(P)H-dependent glycerol-3-phosphate dehydrogenase [Methylicorpusculum sp.]MDZ4154851.1 NAD(P)H-dependent glycerol-3-phosphate dehydrogenase [Methylicorpusculum sp.]
MKQSHVCVLGEGAWGTAVATLLAENGYEVRLWCHDPAIAEEIRLQRTNARYLPEIVLDQKIKPTTDLREAICGARWVFEAIPVHHLRELLQKTIICFSPEQVWVILSKGIEQQTLMVPSQILDDVFGYTVQKAVFSGPSFAYDLSRRQPTAVTLAAIDCAVGLELQVVLANSYFRPYISRDFLGVQLGGALKNIFALGVGILDGAGFGDNVKAFILTRGLREMELITVALGGTKETIYGLSGVGDLVMSAMGGHGRNLLVGRRLGKGYLLADILQTTGYIPEGINTVQSVHQLLQKKNLQAPICTGIYHVIFENKPVEHFLQELMAQPLEQECGI